MPKKFGHFCWHIGWHFSAFSIKATVLLAVIFSIIVTLFIWRVSSSPLDISFAKNYIEKSLHDKATGNYIKMDKVVLYWPDLKGPLYLQLHNGQVIKKNGEVILSTDITAISFSRSALLVGRILPKAIIVKKPTIRLIRNKYGEIAFDFAHNETRKQQKEQFALTTRIFSYIARPGRESETKSLISRLETFAIEDARLLITDEIAQQSWSLPDFNTGFYSTDYGMEGYINLVLPDVGLEKSEIRANLKYLWGQKNVSLSIDLDNIDVKEIAGKVPELDILGDQNIVVDAHIETILDENFVPDDINISLKSNKGQILHPSLSQDFIPYDNFILNASYHYKGRIFTLIDTQITLKGVTIFAKSEVTHNDENAKGSVKIWIEKLDHEQIPYLWPDILRGDNSEKWILNKISNGVFKDLWLSIDIFAKKQLFPENNLEIIGPFKPKWTASFDNLKAGFSFENMNINYRTPLDKVENAYGNGSFNIVDDVLKINITKANIGAVKVKSANMILDQVMVKGKGDIDLSLSLYGHIHDYLNYLSKDPINIDDDMDIDIDSIKGDAKLDIFLKFPASKDVRIKDFKIAADGILENILFPDIINSMDLEAKSLDFSIKDGLVSLNGSAMIENRPINIKWEEFLNSKGKPFKEKLYLSINADPNIRKLMGIDLSDFIEGSIGTIVNYISYNDGRAIADIEADLTSSRFFIDSFDFEKPAMQKATAKLKVYMNNGKISKITNLSAVGSDFKLDNAEIFFQNEMLYKGFVNNFVLGDSRGKLEFAYDSDRNIKIIIKSKFLDARPFINGNNDKNKYDAPAMQIFVTAEKMRTAPNEVISDAIISLDINSQGNFNKMEMDAKIGNGDFRVRFSPDIKGVRSFRLKADDAGAFLKAFQVYDDIIGGTMVIYGKPMRGIFDRNLIGKAEISNFKVINAPFLSKLLSLLSLGGITELMAGDGLNFEKLEVDFNWLFRRNGSLLVLKNGRTSGNSLGLLFDGTFDNEKREVDVSGTIVPMSGLNKVIGSIPIVGDILTGGSGGVFAATYSIKGKSDDPEISVNPLSIITPGILRRILWE